MLRHFILLALDWSKERVKKWAAEAFGEDVAEKFLTEEVTGETLISERITSVDAMERLGLRTLGKQERFRHVVQQLIG